jgi:L-alanine-DL-glutamate epimerase-like enolase superfamily enzyme
MSLALEDLVIEGRIIPLHAPRSISRETNVASRVIRIEAHARGHVGLGEACPMPRYGENIDASIAQMHEVRDDLLSLNDRGELADVLEPGALRNALDAALWDLEAKLAGQSVEALLGLTVSPVETVYTVSLDTPERMALEAGRERARPILKIKLGHFDRDVERLRAVRAAAPDCALVVDANEGWDIDQLKAIAPVAAGLGVKLIEQPLHADRDQALEGFDCPLPLCADESCHTRASLPGLGDRYDMINIKLDKSGGLTEALALARAARDQGLKVMIGCTSATTLAIAPAFLVAQSCVVCDLDAPLYNAHQEHLEVAYDGSVVSFSPSRTWGAP